MKFSSRRVFIFCPCALELLFGESISCVVTNIRVTIERDILDRFFPTLSYLFEFVNFLYKEINMKYLYRRKKSKVSQITRVIPIK